MIKKFINKLLGKSTPGTSGGKPHFGKREEVPASVHGINPELVDRRAADVVATLKQAGFEAYIVGGAVRDLLLGLRPKDFDVATNATPEQVKGLFRRAFIIGKRFRIVHVVHGRGREHEVIEVSTFRAYLDNAAAGQVAGNEKTSKAQLSGMQHAVDASGRVLRDNVWGPQDEDATRRDFTVNAMYYDPVSQIVVDYHKGLQDAKKKTLRMIGDPATRYREDPVRIIRAVRFAAKLSALGFTIETKTAAPLVQSQLLLAEVPQSRMFDEMLKLLQTGHAIATIEQLKKLGMAKGIYPLLDVVVERAATPFVNAALTDTDRRVGEGKPVLDRVLTPETPLDEAAKCALVSMDSTLKSNLSVGLPMDLVVYEADRFTTEKIVCIDEQNPYFRMLHDSWGQKLRAVFDSIEDPAWDGGSTDAPILVNPARSKPLKKITNFRDKLI